MKTTPLIHLVHLARRLNRTAAAKEKTPFVSLLDDLGSVLGTAYKCVLLVGVLPVLGYLLVSLEFYPPGLTIGDSLFFLMVALPFGLAYTMFLAAGFGFGTLILWGAEKLAKNTWVAIGVSVVIIVAILALFLHYHDQKVVTLFKAFVGFSFAGMYLSLVAVCWTGTQAIPPRPGLGLVLAIVGLLMPVMFAPDFMRGLNENVVMPRMGVRQMKVTLKLSEENYEIVASAANGQNLAALSCSTSASGQPERLVHGVNLLWHGFGERSLVELPSDDPHITAPIVELKREGVFVLRNYRGAIERCLELRGDVLFELGSSDLSNDRTELDDMLTILDTHKSKIKRIRVIGHADAVVHPAGTRRNNQLAVERATVVAQLIKKKIMTESVEVTPVGHGAREPKTLCKDWPVKATLSECLAQNRRVEVRIEFLETTAHVAEQAQSGTTPAP